MPTGLYYSKRPRLFPGATNCHIHGGPGAGVLQSAKPPSDEGTVGFVNKELPEGRCRLAEENKDVTRVKPPEARAAPLQSRHR